MLSLAAFLSEKCSTPSTRRVGRWESRDDDCASDPAATSVSNGAAILDDLRAALVKYLVLPTPEAADVIMLWIAASQAQPCWEHKFRHEADVLVPTLRLDEFMEAAGLEVIDVLVSDTQGYGLEVLRSLGTRIDDVRRIEVEAWVDGREQYIGAMNSRDAVVDYLTRHGFELEEAHGIARGAALDLVFVRRYRTG